MKYSNAEEIKIQFPCPSSSRSLPDRAPHRPDHFYYRAASVSELTLIDYLMWGEKEKGTVTIHLDCFGNSAAAVFVTW